MPKTIIGYYYGHFRLRLESRWDCCFDVRRSPGPTPALAEALAPAKLFCDWPLSRARNFFEFEIAF
jgi:hypothetical protein